MLAAVGALIVTPVQAAGGAPEQLRNKTVTMSWTTSGTATGAGGKSRPFTNVNTRIVYISSAGRPFLRAQLSGTGNSGGGGHHSRSGERGPEDTSRGSVHFEGSRLIGVETFASGARQFIASFAAGYSSCTLAVIDAKAGSAAIQRRGPDGAMYKIENATTGSPSCSIASGNAFAGQ
jgi:hypothetical protein